MLARTPKTRNLMCTNAVEYHIYCEIDEHIEPKIFVKYEYKESHLPVHVEFAQVPKTNPLSDFHLLERGAKK